MSVRSEMVRTGLRWLIKHRNHRELTVEQHRRFVTVAERLVPDPPPHTRTLPVDADGVRADLIVTPASEGERHVLFLHGGAFIIGSRASAGGRLPPRARASLSGGARRRIHRL